MWAQGRVRRAPVAAFALALRATVSVAATGYEDTFSGPALFSGWASDSRYVCAWDNASMRVEIRKSDRWQGLYLNLGGTYDFSAKPVVNLKVRTTSPFTLHVYLVDVNNRNILTDRRVHAAGHVHELCYDFATVSKPAGFDLTRIKAMIFAANGSAMSLRATAWFDDLRVGDSASRFASLSVVPERTDYAGSRGHRFFVTDVANASALEAPPSSALLENIAVAAISNGIVDVRYDCRPGLTGSETLSLTARGTGGFADHVVPWHVRVEPNAAPTLDPVPDQELATGQTQTIDLRGISDGNGATEQPLTFRVDSADPSVIPASSLAVSHAPGSPYATLRLRPARAGRDVPVSVTVDDGAPSNHATTVTFHVSAFARFNLAPRFDPVADPVVKLGEGAQSLRLTGLDDGNGGRQQLALSAASSNPTVLPDDAIALNLLTNGTALVTYTPAAEGTTTVTLRLRDDGADTDNGPRDLTRTFALTVLPALPTALVETFHDLDAWQWSGTYSASLSTIGGTNALRMVCSNKNYWDGYTLTFEPNLDLSAQPCLSMEVYAQTQATLHWLWFYDDRNIRNINVGAMDKAVWAPTGQWTRMVFDFRGAGAMQDSDGTPLNAERITYALLNMHNAEAKWPLPASYSGTFYMRNVRVGDAADLGVPSATIDGLADQALPPEAGPQVVRLTGLSDGAGGRAVTVTAQSSAPGLVPHPTVSAPGADGRAELTYTPGSGTGRATITVTVRAAASLDAVTAFDVDIVAVNAATVQTVQVDATQLFQTVHGFGTYQFEDRPQYVDAYTADLGASAMRLGLISNQLEPANDNTDPRVLNRAGLNYGAFDFDYVRQLRARGVETFILTSWSPPGWMKKNLSDNYGYATAIAWENTDNKLEPHNDEEFAESMVAAVRLFQEEAGITLYAIGLQNEPAFCEPYPSAVVSPARFVQLVKTVGRRFRSEGIPTRLYLPEQVFSQSFYSMKQYVDALHADPEADALTDIIATHGYAEDGVQPGQPDFSGWSAMYANAQQGSHPKELWMSETYPEGGTWDAALSLAGAMHGALAYGNVSLWTLWSIEGTLMRSGQPLPSFHSAAHYSRFVRPGARRVACASPHADLMASSYTKDAFDHDTLVTVLINKGDTAIPVRVTTNRPISQRAWFLSSENRSLEERAASPADVLLLPPRSVATVVDVRRKPGTAIGIRDAAR